MLAALDAPVVFLQTVPLVLVMDLFTFEEPSQPSHEKSPHLDDDPNAVRLYAGLTEE